jgi:hypothetical protein
MRKWNALVLLLPLLLAGCDSDDNPSSPAPVVPATPTPTPTATPTPAASSPYAGNWIYRTTLTAVDGNCGHTPGDIGTSTAPVGVTIASDGTFALRSGSEGRIDSAGNVSFTIAAEGGSCVSGTAAGGCRDTDHCDGTSVQAGDVRKWTLFRQ